MIALANSQTRALVAEDGSAVAILNGSVDQISVPGGQLITEGDHFTALKRGDGEPPFFNQSQVRYITVPRDPLFSILMPIALPSADSVMLVTGVPSLMGRQPTNLLVLSVLN
jgi:hypothetical protein